MKNKNKKEFNELPAKVSQKDFNKYIKPHLSQGTRGPKSKISLYKIFNYILYVLHTGCQWDKLPIRKNEIHWSAVYNRHNRWSKDGSYKNLFLHSVKILRDNGELDLSILHNDGSNTVAKKGVNR
jgi:hypothetical protein